MGTSMLTMGVIHLVVPEQAHRVLPASVGSPKRWARVVALVETGAGVLLLQEDRRSRRVGGALALAALASAHAATIDQAVRAGKPTTPQAIGVWVRVPMQLPTMFTAFRLARG